MEPFTFKGYAEVLRDELVRLDTKAMIDGNDEERTRIALLGAELSSLISDIPTLATQISQGVSENSAPDPLAAGKLLELSRKLFDLGGRIKGKPRQ